MKLFQTTSMIALIALLLHLPAAHADDAAQTQDLAQLQEQVRQLQEENEQLKQQLAKALATIEDLTGEKQQLEQLAGVTIKGEAVESRIALFESEYDAEADRTVVSSKPEKIIDVSATTLAEIMFFTRYEYAGEEMTEAPSSTELSLLFLGYSTDRLKHTETVRLILDGRPIDLPLASFDQLAKRKSAGSSRSSVGGVTTYDHQLTVTLDSDTLRKVSRARTMRIALPNISLNMSGEQIATFVAIRKRMDMGI